MMIGGYIAKKGLKKVKDKVKGNKKSIGIEEENDSDGLLGLDVTSESRNGNEGSKGQEDSNIDDSDEPEESSTDNIGNEGNSDEEKSPKGGKGSKGGTPSTMSIAKVVFKFGLWIGIGVIVLCAIMSFITMFTVTTGTAVQIVDGSILTYGEATPDPNKKDGKSGDSNAKFDGDELYTKAKMIVEEVEKNPSKKKKVDNIKLPNSVPTMWRNEVTNTRGGYYHLVEVEYILREMTKTNFYKNFKLSESVSISTEDIEFAMMASAIQESSFGSGYNEGDNWNKNKSWLRAHIFRVADSYEGPWQMSDTYMNNGYLVFVTSLENPSLGDYGKISTRNSFKKSDMKINVESRKGSDGSTAFIKGDNVHWHFSDMAATALYAMQWQGISGRVAEYKELLKAYGSSYSGDVAKYLNAAIFDEVERVPHNETFSFDTNGKSINNGKSGTVGKALAELAVGGYLTDESMSKFCPKLNAKDQATWKSELCGPNASVGKATTERKAKTDTNASACRGLTEQTFSPLAKLFMSYRIELEVRAVVDTAFDALGLQLPSGEGGSLALKETKGKFQGLWSDKTGKTLTSEEMLSYKSSGNAGGQDNAKLVGLKEQSYMKVNYSNDPFKKKFGDNVGVIWYHQSSANAWGSYLTHPNAGSGNTIVQSFCGGYSTSIVLSTMLHRYINPPEIIYAAHSYKARHGGSACTFNSGEGKFLYQNQNMLINEQKFNKKQVLKAKMSSTLTQKELDKTLNDGGMAIACFTYPIAAGAGHFVVIRSKDSSGNYYLADPSHSDSRPEKQVNHKFSFGTLSGYSKGQVNYVVPGPGYDAYLSANSSDKSTDIGNGWVGNLMSNKDFPYWIQTNVTKGTGKNQCPMDLPAGCGVYSEIKILKALGVNKSFTQLYNAGNGIIRLSGTVCIQPEGVPKLAEKYGLDLNYSQDNSKYNITKSSEMEKVATDIAKVLKKGGYCMMEIDYKPGGNRGGAGGGDHFVVVSASNGKQVKIWDSGHVGITNAEHSAWFSYYKNKGTPGQLNVTRLSYYWPK